MTRPSLRWIAFHESQTSNTDVCATRGTTAPVGSAQNGGHPNGDIMCGGAVCGTVQWGDAPAQPASIGPVEIGLGFMGGVSLLRGAAEDVVEGAASWLGRTLGVGGEEEGADAIAGEGSAAGGSSSDYVDVTRPGSEYPNRPTNVTPQEFGDNLQAEGFKKSVRGNLTVYTKGSTEYDVYPQARSTVGPTAQVKVAGKVVAKIRLQP